MAMGTLEQVWAESIMQYIKLFYIFPFIIFISLFITSCQQRPIAQGQQYQDGQFEYALNLAQPQLTLPINIDDYIEQVNMIQLASPSLYEKNKHIYDAINLWINQALLPNQFNRVGLSSYQMAGQDSWGNVHLTGYYTPVLQARHYPDDEFRYPLYRKPMNWSGDFPSRADVYQGALAGQGLEAAYTRSLIDNFIMEVQGSGYIDFENGEPLVFFSYGGKNGHKYQSIGRLLIEQNEIEKDKISMQAIKAWADKQHEDRVVSLLVQNPSVVFFTPKYDELVAGAAGVPLIAKASVASDRTLIALGSVLLVEIPMLNSEGQFNGSYELRLMVALDVGSAIKGQHFDIYQGIGHEAGEQAGFYNHYGRAWLLQPELNSHLSSPIK